MLRATLTRNQTGDQGTFGTLVLESGEEFRTAELPWRENAPYFSCVPTGWYRCEWTRSPRFGPVYQLKDVPNRTHILIHQGNYAGDRKLGFRSDTDGCILLGQQAGRLNEQSVVLRSRVALLVLRQTLKEQPFLLTIR